MKIEEKVSKFKPDEDEDPEAEFTGSNLISVTDLLYRYSTPGDRIYMYCGVSAAFGFGASLPGFCLVFGEMIDSMGE